MKHFFFILLLTVVLLPSGVSAQSPGDIVPVDEATVGNFQPITSIPVFGSVENIGRVDLTTFFNQLYVLAVGAAAIVAVAQIMLAGFQLAIAQGSHSAIGEARDKIRNAVFGLLLVLSPTIVFGVINPDILNLRIDTGLLTDRNAISEYVEGGETPDTEDVAITLRGNKWGAYDNVCDFGADGLVETWIGGGFKIKPQVSVKKFGNGVSVNQGRQCCALSGGTLTTVQTSGVETPQEVCDLSGVIGETRFVAHIEAVVTKLIEEGGSGIVKGESRPGFFFSSGAGKEGGAVVGDVDTIIIHGFRSRSACESFVNGLTPASLTKNFKERTMFLPAIGLLEGMNSKYRQDGSIQWHWGDTEEMLPSTLSEVESITKRSCDGITFGIKN